MTDRAIRAPQAEDGESRTYIVKAWRVKLGDFVEEGDPVCDLSFEGAVVTVNSPAKGDIQNINRIEGQQAEAGYVIGLVGFGADKRILVEDGEALSSKEKSSKSRHALKFPFNRGWRQKLAIVLIAGVAVGAVKSLYNYFTEPSFENLLGREMRAELERWEGVSRSDSPNLSQSLELSDLEELADFYFGLGQRDGALKLMEYFYLLSDEDYSQGREEELWSEAGELVGYLSGLTFSELTEPAPLPSRFNNFGALRDNRDNRTFSQSLDGAAAEAERTPSVFEVLGIGQSNRQQDAVPQPIEETRDGTSRNVAALDAVYALLDASVGTGLVEPFFRGTFSNCRSENERVKGAGFGVGSFEHLYFRYPESARGPDFSYSFLYQIDWSLVDWGSLSFDEVEGEFAQAFGYQTWRLNCFGYCARLSYLSDFRNGSYNDYVRIPRSERTYVMFRFRDPINSSIIRRHLATIERQCSN